MPPLIAFLLCILFILYALIRDFRNRPYLSNAIWVPLIWFMIVGSRPIGYWLSPPYGQISLADFEGVSLLNKIVFSALILIGITILRRREIHWSNIFKKNIFLFLFFFYAVVSLFWSDFPIVAFKRWIRGIGGLMMVLIILTESDSKEAIKATFLRCAYVLVPLSVLTIKYYRHIGVQYNRWTGDPFLTGITTDKNALGRLCLISSLFFLWNFFELKTQKRLFVDKKDLIINTIMMMSIAWLLMKSNSATSIGALVIGIFVIAGLGLPFIRQNPERLSWFIFLLFVTIVIFEYSFNLTEIVVVRGLGRNMTFTYRTFIWRDLISLDSAPLIGVGFGSFWLGDRLRSLAEIGWKTLGEAHNGYLEIYLSLGIIGLGILTAAIVSCYRNIRRKLIYDFENARFQLALLFIILIYNITESAFRESSLIFFVFLLLSLDRDRQEQYRI